MLHWPFIFLFFYCRNWFLRREEGQGGLLNDVDRELRNEDEYYYKIFMRLQDAEFDHVLSLIIDDIIKEDTVMRNAIDPRQRLVSF